MAIFNIKSVEIFIATWVGLLVIVVIGLVVALLALMGCPYWCITIIALLAFLLAVLLINHMKLQITASFHRALLHIEAIKLGDYNQISKPIFPVGCVDTFHQELKNLSQYLSNNKIHYDKHAFLVYQLIDQLNTPVLVFDKSDRLTYANSAFSALYNQPWQVYRNASQGFLGITKDQGNWAFRQKSPSWEIRHSRFLDNGEIHQLMVFINIEPVLNETQMNSWQQIVRVISHEINNSLTPVSSLAQSLVTHTEVPRDRMALELISQRCNHLQDFINRYSSLSRQMELMSTRVSVSDLTQRLKGLFPDMVLEVQVDLEWIWADSTFLEQVLINLIKNSREAGADRVILHSYRARGRACIDLTDNGRGFGNLKSAFVPLFTTKQDGHGIGLSFCRNIINQHRGSISLVNNAGPGVKVSISLPSINDPDSGTG
ncbi:hypothetical protein CBP51_05015 [Cellvibrio mixtus]|uniref:histidine kinase n=1 Tax=Cellvibrio mixtus TaxID=39650 RepID=A0A266Q984_9GAMM|nr:ATP-binding protein [Cellvibrio mixtus]OZY86390.1 hypothetical protein CBP51_05015 [Cellvibrio mixtus]